MIISKYFKNPLHPITISLIGVGGTGSLVLPRLARMNFGLKQMGHPGLMVFSYDDDVVETYNVGRQNFSDCDISKNKAFAITEKCNLAWGTVWEALPIKYALGKNMTSNIHIICVDNAEFRKKYYESSEELTKKKEPYLSNFFTIDCGNGKNFGQVIISDSHKQLKNPFDLYPDMINQDNEETQGMASCSYAESLEKQDMFINDQISVECVKILWSLFRKEELNINGVVVNAETNKTLPLKIF